MKFILKPIYIFSLTALIFSVSAHALPGDIISVAKVHQTNKTWVSIHDHLFKGEMQVRPHDCANGIHAVLDVENSKCSLRKFTRCDLEKSRDLGFMVELPLSACSGSIISEQIGKKLYSKPEMAWHPLQFGRVQCIQTCNATDENGKSVHVTKELSFSDDTCTSGLSNDVKAIISATEAEVINQIGNSTQVAIPEMAVNGLKNCQTFLEEVEGSYVH